MNGNDGTGQDGADGSDGLDGLDGLGFGFVRGIDNSEVTGSYWFGDASCVVPEQILEIAPAYDGQGLILYLGTEDSPFSYYLICGLAIVELETLAALDLLGAVADKGEVVEAEGTARIDVKRHYVRIRGRKIEFRRND